MGVMAYRLKSENVGQVEGGGVSVVLRWGRVAVERETHHAPPSPTPQPASGPSECPDKIFLPKTQNVLLSYDVLRCCRETVKTPPAHHGTTASPLKQKHFL